MTKCKRGKLAIRLCELMGWEGQEWKVWCQALTIDKLEDLIKRLDGTNDQAN